MSDTVRKIIEMYGYAPHTVHSVQKGYRNQSWPVTLTDGQIVNVIIYKSEPDILTKIKNAHSVSSFLFEQGFPVRHTFNERIIMLRGLQRTTYAGLYTYLPGETIPWEAYTQKHIKMLGKTLSDVHHTLKDFDARTLARTSDVVSEYRHIVERMQRYFGDSHVSEAVAHKLGLRIPHPLFVTLATTLEAADHLRGKQALHMDFVRSNILFSDIDKQLTISGLLDFEKTAYGHPIVDIARTLAFLLVDCKFKSEMQVRKYFLYSGYHKRGLNPLPRIRITRRGTPMLLLDGLVDLFLFYDFYKFLRHNPYESLEENEHYLRTRDLLVQRKRIMTI